jgi:hypothetical protein
VNITPHSGTLRTLAGANGEECGGQAIGAYLRAIVLAVHAYGELDLALGALSPAPGGFAGRQESRNTLFRISDFKHGASLRVRLS